MVAIQHFTTEQARDFGDKFGTDWDWSSSCLEQFSRGGKSELADGEDFVSEATPGKPPSARVKKRSASLKALPIKKRF